MKIYVLIIVVLACFASVLAGVAREKKRINKPVGFILQGVFCLFVLAMASYGMAALFGMEDIGGGSTVGSGLFTVEDLFGLSLWIAGQLVVCALLTVGLRAWNLRGIGIATHSFGKNVLKGFGTAFVLAMGFIAVAFSLKTTAESKLLINEVCSKNENVLADDDGKYGDYIELYNPTRFNISLSDFYVIDDLDKNPKSVSNDAKIVARGGYVIVWPEEGKRDFGISSDGDAVYLLRGNGDLVDSVVVPELEEGTVYARDASDLSWAVYVPSPMEASAQKILTVDAPVFSAESGFYDDDFTLTLSADEGCTIYYTLDSSIPDENSTVYSDGIEVTNVCDQPNVYRAVQNVVFDWEEYTPTEEIVDKAFVVRAVAMDENGNQSDVVTKTYFVDMDEYENGYVLSLVSDPDGLFGDDGIYVTGEEYDEWYIGGQQGEEPEVNFKKKGYDYEIESSVELFDNANLLMSQMAGIRIQGAGSRQNALKKFSIFARKEYSGSRYFSYDIFGYGTHKFYLRDDFADVFLETLVTDREIGGGLCALPISLFLDGEFWYDTYLREKYSEDYLAEKYNLDRDKITLKSWMPPEITDYLEEHVVMDDKEYEEFGKLLDIDNYIDYMVYNIYLCNMDLSENKNVKIWKSTGNSGLDYDDGKWRFLIYDMDSITWNNSGNNFYGIDSYGINSFSQDKRYTSPAYDQQTIFVFLKQNPDFCRQFVLTFMDFANTYFEKDNVDRQLEEWGYDSTWCNSFFDRRFDCIVPDLAEEFNLTGTLEQITLATDVPDGGAITINTVTPELTDGEWSGYYYTDYPVTISAEAADGYEFVAWHHGDEVYTESELEVELNSGDNSWTAEFEITEQ